MPRFSVSPIPALALAGLALASAAFLVAASAQTQVSPQMRGEAMTLMHRATRGSSHRLAVDVDLYRQTAAILATRAEPLGIEIVTATPAPVVQRPAVVRVQPVQTPAAPKAAVKAKPKPKYAVGTPSTRISTNDEPDMNAKSPP